MEHSIQQETAHHLQVFAERGLQRLHPEFIKSPVAWKNWTMAFAPWRDGLEAETNVEKNRMSSKHLEVKPRCLSDS
jgi:hypothetical protein